MALLDIPQVSEMLSQLQKEFSVYDSSSLYADYLKSVASATEWKYYTHDYPNDYLPFSSLLSGYKPKLPKLVKRKFSSPDEARSLGKYSVGFNKNLPVVAVFAEDNKKLTTLSAELLSYSDNTITTRYFTAFNINRKKPYSDIGGLAKYFQLSKDMRAEVRVGHNAFSVTVYNFENNIPVYAQMYSKGWPCECKFYFHYDDKGTIVKLTIGAEDGHVHWERSIKE